MNTKPNPYDLIREMLDSDPVETVHDQEVARDDSDELIGTALAHLDLTVLSPEAQDLLLALTAESASLEPSARQKFVAATDRALRKRRDNSSPLPRLLFLARQERGETTAEVASDLGLELSTFDKVERGVLNVKQLTADSVAAWIRHFEVEPPVARTALLSVLQLQDAEELAAASATSSKDPEDDDFFREVMKKLEDDAHA